MMSARISTGESPRFFVEVLDQGYRAEIAQMRRLLAKDAEVIQDLRLRLAAAERRLEEKVDI